MTNENTPAGAANDNGEVKYVLVGDVGGTNTRLQLFELQLSEISVKNVPRGSNAPGKVVHGAEFSNEKFTTFEEIVAGFLEESGKPIPSSACFAVAGPVDTNAVSFTNKSAWKISGDQLQETLKIKQVQLVNDFLANGYGLLTLGKDEVETIQEGNEKPGKYPIVAVGAGTGLGECYLTPDKQGEYTCFGSEGGHAEFAPRNHEEMEMLIYLSKKYRKKPHPHRRISVERVVSGKGIANVYEFLCHKHPRKKDKKVYQEFLAAGDQQGGVVAQNAGKCKLAKRAMDIMMSAYASEIGVAALKWMPFGGLYITGGIAMKNLELLKAESFLSHILDKGRVSGFIHQIPIHVVVANDLGQRGALLVAYKLLQEELAAAL